MKGSLEGLRGVSRVDFDSQRDTFIVDGATGLSDQQVRSAVLGTVVLPGVRRFLGNLGRSWAPGIRGPG